MQNSNGELNSMQRTFSKSLVNYGGGSQRKATVCLNNLYRNWLFLFSNGNLKRSTCKCLDTLNNTLNEGPSWRFGY